MKIHSFNEWDQLKEIVVGSARGANWPSDDPVFAKESEKTLWKETPVPSGPVPAWIIEETEEDLEGLCDILRQAGVVVHRPQEIDFAEARGMYNYCPRDRLIIAGDQVVDPAMMYPCRNMELQAYHEVVDSARIYHHMPRNEGMILDAANVLRLDDRWLFLESASGNHAAYEWLCNRFPEIKIELCNFYSGVHIDSTITVLCEGTVLLNGSRVNHANCPRIFDGWRKIYINDVVPQNFFAYPYASKWIALNMLSINSSTVIVDAAQREIIKLLEQMNFTVIPHTLRHSRTLGGGFHCVTLDTWREHA
jgi:scyllo-inosamine-4-phosphate amidinotransferase 1